MAGFDPDAYLAKKAPSGGGGFDPDAYLSAKSKPATLNAEMPKRPASTDAPGIGQTLLEHGLGGYFANYSDEIAGQMERLDPRLQQPGAAVTMPDGSTKFIESGDDAAAATQAVMRDSLKKTADEHPVAAFIGNMGGELLRDATLAGVGVPVGSLPYAIVSGALSGSGAADEDTPGGKLGGAALGGVAGGVGGYVGAKMVGPALSLGRKALGAIPDAVKEFAERRAFKAAGPMLKNFRELAAQGRDKDIGRDLLDEGVVGFGDDVSAISKKAGERLQSIGSAIGDARNAIDNIVPQGALPTGEQLADRIEQEIVSKLRSSPVQRPYAPAVKKMADEFRAEGTKPISLNRLTEWKAHLNDMISHPPDPAFPLKQKQAVARVLKDTEDDLVQNVAGTEPAAAYGEAKRLYGNLANVADFSADKALREEANRIVSPSDHAFGAVAAMGNIAKGGSAGEASLWGAALALANKLARERGNSAAAVTLDALADSAPMQWLKMLPAAQSEKYLLPIANAALRGPQALSATIFALSQQDPDFRALKEQAQGR